MTTSGGERIMRLLAGLLVRVFFRGIDVSGGERLPAAPTVVVANHTNGLVDGLLLIATLGRYPRFLGSAAVAPCGRAQRDDRRDPSTSSRRHQRKIMRDVERGCDIERFIVAERRATVRRSVSA
jgi:hypothetical protein